MKPCDAADLDDAALDALLDAELAELASEASSSQPSSPQSLARDSHVIAANTTLGRDDAADARDDDQGSQGSRDSLAEAWEHLHLGNESRHQNADKFEKDFQELLGLARYKADIDPVVRVVVGELIDAVPALESDGSGCKPTTSIYSSDAKEAEAKFLASLQAEADAREMERKQMMKEIEEQRKQQRAALEVQWAREDAAIRIQRAARGWNARKAQQQRRAATGLLQRALRSFGAKIRGFRVRQRLRREKEVQMERSFMTAEDQLARSLRALLWEEQTNMEREDSLARAIRLAESAAQAKARRDMTLEDAYARELRDVEQAKTRREQNAMSAEDVLSQRLHAHIRSEWQAMQSEDDAAQAVRASSSKLLELSAVGNTAYLSGKDLCDLRDAVPSEKCAMLTCIVAERNRFSRFDCVTHRELASRLSSLQLARNELVSLQGIDVCAQTLEYLDVSGNRLSVAALKPLQSLRNLRVVNLSSNALGHFDGERNAIEGPALLDSSCMLPELLELKLAGNPLRKLRQRSAHLCPGLQSLDLREVRTSEQDLVEALVEHIHLTGLELGGRALSRSATKYTCRFLRRLKSVNGDTFFRERAFEREIVLLQAAWRGARTRERIRRALDRTQEGYGEEDGDFDLEFASVDMDSFIPQLDEAELALDPERNMQNSRDREELQSTPDPTRGYQKALRSARSRHAEEEAEEAETMPQRSGRSLGQNAKSRKGKNTKPSRRVGLNFMSVNRRDRQQHMLKRSRKLVPAWARKGQGNES
ncbi:Dynein light chain 1, axonemal [Hondaea fermentalgiana]|uniref:Dynein light chain 1, axonemal n=1 Tax=Hondaea fermentalgiana TaxID=2315210 RepID=A0A2R5GN58_9STRA|nr:Dynein light chain 1, axonemal [Hondaea fermentalgiana]|eukprot:GBG31168.1 Dynein light chain 1, axonemal [Hondaea fermentalgiana]